MTTTCPVCGGAVTQEDATTFDVYAPPFHVIGRPLPLRQRETTVAACAGCDFLVDLRRVDGVLKSAADLLKEVAKWVER